MSGKNVVINFYSKKYNYNSYLEIGGQPDADESSTWAKIELSIKDTVDPNISVKKEDMPAGCVHYMMTSDEFFGKYRKEKKYDVIFIDGLHDHAQVARDIEGSLACLKEDGTITDFDIDYKTSLGLE